ncbi:dihydrolipoamide acetyltransferase family protein, partial [Gemmatimonadota bacterium]
PQMGESIAEGTVSKWLKQVGEFVQRDEAILEISTDKVDAEIPAPAEGILVEVLVAEGETVEVGTVVAYIDPDAESGVSAESPALPGETLEAAATGGVPGVGLPPAPGEVSQHLPSGDHGSADATGFSTDVAQAEALVPPFSEGEGASADERLRARSTPVVRKIAEEHGVDLATVQGTGHAGRVTKQDILSFIEARTSASEPQRTASPPASPVVPATPIPSDLWTAFYGQVQHPEFSIRASDRVEPMDKIRRLTAEHMVLAKRVAPHVHSFIEIDFSAVDELRRANKARWAEQDARVSFTAFVVWACSRVLREFPQVNATISGHNLVFRGNVNVGIAVDLDPGLIVPVIHDADDLSLVGIARRIVDLAERARSRRLNPEEIQGATFSITNPGVLGTMVGMPIIPKGTAAILGTGAIEKRVVVLEDPVTGTDSMAIRKRALFSLGYDHRLVDGADAARFLARLKELMESFPEDA